MEFRNRLKDVGIRLVGLEYWVFGVLRGGGLVISWCVEKEKGNGGGEREGKRTRESGRRCRLP